MTLEDVQSEYFLWPRYHTYSFKVVLLISTVLTWFPMDVRDRTGTSKVIVGKVARAI